MKTQKHKLDFTKKSIVELNDEKMHDVKGGGTLTSANCLITLSISLVVSIIIATMQNEE